MLNQRTFVFLLLFATVVPFFIGALTVFDLIGVSWLISLIAFLALIHVPMTAYLFFDGEIRAQMARRKLMMIGGCVLLMVLSLVFFTAVTVEFEAQQTKIISCFVLAAVMWQHWHFGKQNIGVLALARIATNSGPLMKFERYTMTAASICGIAAAYLVVGKATQGVLWSFDAGQFRWLQYLIAAAALGCVMLNIARYTAGTGALYLLGVCFFLPQFLAVDLPQYVYIFGSSILAHGTQYILILFYHSLGLVDLNRRVSGQRKMAQTLWLFAPLFFFALTFAIATNFYTSHSLWSFNDAVTQISAVAQIKIGPATISAIASGLIWGILLCHFWLDSFFWRLKESGPRQWVKSRYAFLFAHDGK